jgi:hypothetical protein
MLLSRSDLRARIGRTTVSDLNFALKLVFSKVNRSRAFVIR